MKKYYLSEAGSDERPIRMLKLDSDEYEAIIGLLVVAHLDKEMRSHLEEQELEIIDHLYMQI